MENIIKDLQILLEYVQEEGGTGVPSDEYDDGYSVAMGEIEFRLKGLLEEYNK